MSGSNSWWRRMRSNIDGKSILINCSMVRTRTPPFSWTTRLMTQALCAEDSDEVTRDIQGDIPWWRRMRSDINGKSILINCSIVRIRTQPFSWMTLHDTNRRFVRRIQESEVREVLKRMKGGKAMGPDGIPIKVWRCLGDIAIVWLTKLFNHIFRSNKMPDEMWLRHYYSKGGRY